MDWLNAHLLTCPFKYFTGIDCPGCGFQRSVLALLAGNLRDSVHLYPATIPILAAAVFLIIQTKVPLKYISVIKNGIYLTLAGIILISYSIKLLSLPG
ncbi:hypothetical protein A0256_03835 [Mucilaginibacter sp. PAMC 26640]|nr:hypothetical protein A0256_03835 [Mucilaginibacter sp. PAMC 26640]